MIIGREKGNGLAKKSIYKIKIERKEKRRGSEN